MNGNFFFINDFKSVYHDSLAKQRIPATDEQIKSLAKEISTFIGSLIDKSIYSKNMTQNIVAACAIMYPYIISKDNSGGIEFLKQKVEEKTITLTGK